MKLNASIIGLLLVVSGKAQAQEQVGSVQTDTVKLTICKEDILKMPEIRNPSTKSVKVTYGQAGEVIEEKPAKRERICALCGMG